MAIDKKVEDAPAVPPGIHLTPIKDRAPVSKVRVYATCGALTIVLGLLHLSQLVLWPMTFIPGGIREMYWDYIRASKESFARVLVFISRGSSFVISADESIDLDKVLKKDEEGLMRFHFDERAIWISNHQCYPDWILVWAFFYLSNLAGAVVIVLKASLQYIPIGGPAMKLWKFIFLSNWDKDKVPTGENLKMLGKRATKHKRGLALLLYPEGTLVSALTRPRSKKYADKLDVPDMKNTLLPRSTGFLFCLRSLMPVVPDLAVYDITVGYPGLPAAGYAQSYYTLGSVYGAGQAPPVVHLHLRKIPLSSIPFGKTPDGSLSPEANDDALTEEERKKFDVWLRERWTEKDKLMDRYYEKGEFVGDEDKGISRREIEIKLGGIDDYLALGTNLIPAYMGYRLAKYLLYRYLLN